MKETDFERKTVKELEKEYPECIILKLDPLDRQGIPDRIMLCPISWGALEFKESAKAKHQPNQDYYVEKMNDMSFARFIYPENEKEVRDELQQKFPRRRDSRIP
jgi:hypothetical protein